MSKSKGEFLTVSLLEERGFDPLVYRFFCMQSHYRKNLVFSWENLENARTAYNKLVSKVASLKPCDGDSVDESAFAEGKKRFTDALDNDLNTSLAVTALYDVLKARTTPATKLALIADFDRVLDLGLIAAAEKVKKESEPREEDDGIDHNDPFVKEIEALIVERAEAKKAKNYARADEIRQLLADKGVTLIDTPQGTKFKL